MKRKMTRALALILMVCMLLPQSVFAANDNKTYNLEVSIEDEGKKATGEVVADTAKYLTGDESLVATIALVINEGKLEVFRSPAMRDLMREGIRKAAQTQVKWDSYVKVTMEGAEGTLYPYIESLSTKVNALEVNKEYEMTFTNEVKGDNKYGVTYTITVKLVERASSAAVVFKDVPTTFWAYNEIMWAYENGYMNGVSSDMFNPNGNVTRQQVWMILARHSGANPANMVQAKAWAMENGISDGTNPGNPVTRQQLVALLYRYADMQGYDVSARADLTTFPDYASVSDYAKEPMSWSVANGIVTGTTQGTLNPHGNATRAQFAVILYRFCDKML